MLDRLIALTETGEFEDSGGFRFSSIEETSDGLILEVTVVPGDETDEQRWSIQCSSVREYRMYGEFATEVRVVSEHAVLLPFTEHVTQLYFSCPAPNPLATVGALWERHRQLVGSWLPFERFLNVLPNGLSGLLAVSSGGQLAGGPVSLLQAYAEVLTDHDVRWSLLPPRPPRYWDGGQWIVSMHPLHALVFDRSYVVAERFDAERSGT
jgi:hypothetical protein